MTSPAPVDVTPSLRATVEIRVVEVGDSAPDVDAVALPVLEGADVPGELDLDLDALARAGFRPGIGQALAVPRRGGPVLVAVGVGAAGSLDVAGVRDAAAAFAAAVPFDGRLATQVPQTARLSAAEAAAAVVEGVLLARYRFSMRSAPDPRDPVAVSSLVLIAPRGTRHAVEAAAARGLAQARAAMLGRDLAMCPAGALTASRMAEVAVDVGERAGLSVEVFDETALEAMGCGGLLGVNRGSVQPPRMVRLRYEPDGEPVGRLTLVGKGIMYDSGGINLKPSDESHSQMKNDMTGAACIVGAMSVLGELGCRSAVTGYLMCTDNMPSGSAMQLGDVLTIRGGRTVEILNTDAEGRLVMADALVLATEEPVDAIVDIATLTGACLRTFGTEIAGAMGNDDALFAQVEAAGAAADEPVWRLPLVRRYRSQLDSEVADMTNLGGPNAGSITAGLFLEEFVDGLPWAHIDIAGTAQAAAATRWVNKGPTAFGTRLLVQLALAFTPPRATAAVPTARQASDGAAPATTAVADRSPTSQEA